MTLTVNGVNMLPYVAFSGIKWQGSSIDGEDAGRGLDGTMYRDKRADKVRLDVTCKPLTTAEASIVLRAIKPEWVSVTYLDPEQGTTLTKTMYSNNKPAQYLIQRTDGTELWSGITFPLIER